VRVVSGSADAYWRAVAPATGYLTLLVQSDNEGPVNVEIGTGDGGRGIRVAVDSARGGAAVLRIVDGVLDDFLVTGANAFLGSSVTPSVGVDGGEVRGSLGQDLARIGGETRTLLP
jgi:beta-galactosidase